MRGRSSSLIVGLCLLLATTPAWAMPQALIYVGALLIEEYTIAAIVLIVVGTVWGQAEQRKALREQEQAARDAYNASLKDRMATIISGDAPHVYVYGKDVVAGVRVVDALTTGDRDQYHHLVCVVADHQCEAITDIALNDKWLGPLDANGYVTQGDFYYTFPVDVTEYKTGTVFNLAHVPVEGSLTLTYWEGSMENGTQHSMPYTIVGTEVTVDVSHWFACSYQWTDAIPRVRVIKRLGVPGTPANQVTIDECLAYATANGKAPEYTSTCTLDGKTALILRVDLDHAEFQRGIPQIKVKADGKLVHDVRDPLFPNDVPACSGNNALCISDYLMSKMCGVPNTDLPLDDYIAAANACDTGRLDGCTYVQTGNSVTVTKTAHGKTAGMWVPVHIDSGDATSGSYTVASATADTFTYIANSEVAASGNCHVEGLYTLNGTVSSDQDQQQVLEAMARSMAGSICGTTWSIKAGVWAAPVMTLSQEDIVGDFGWVAGSSDADLFNGVKGQFVSAANLYVPTDFTPYQNDVYVAADGVEKWADIMFPFTDTQQRVDNICRILVEDQRNAFSIEGFLSYKAWDLQEGERITFDFPFLGQSGKIYRAVRKKVGIKQAVWVGLKEDAASIWDLADAAVEDSTPNTNLPNPFSVAPLASLTCSSGTDVLQIGSDGTIVSRILVEWPLPTTQGVVHGGVVEVEWKPIGSDAWSKTQVTGDETKVYISPVKDGLFYNIRARAVNLNLNVKSIDTYAVHQVVGKTQPPSDVTGVLAIADATGVTIEWAEIADADRSDYEVMDEHVSGTVTAFYGGSSVRLKPGAAGLHTYRVRARDTSKLLSVTAASTTLNIQPPAAPILSNVIVDGMCNLSWPNAQTTHQVKHYELRWGVSWAESTVIGQVNALSYRLTANWTGDRSFFIAATDLADNQGEPSSIVVAINQPAAPNIVAQFVADRIKLSWAVPGATLPVETYEIRYGASWATGTSLGVTRSLNFELRAAFTGSRTFWIAATDRAGNTGTPGAAEAIVTPAPAPGIVYQVIDNNVLLYWTEVAGTLPTRTYELRKGATWATAVPIGTKAGGFTTVFETQSGVFTYWIAAIDSADNYGAPGSATATVMQPPDYVLKADYDSAFPGTKVNMTPHDDLDGSWITPVNTTETFEQHFTAHSWATPQAQVDAGFPIYIQPNLSPGSYEEVIDYGVVLANNRITVTLNSLNLVGAVAKSCTISVSADGASWTDYVGHWQIYATNFRYAKVHLTFTAANSNDLLEVIGLNIRLDSKLKTVTKMVACDAADVGGTVVYLTDDWTATGNQIFIDVDAIQITPQGTAPLTAVYDFVDTPNPLSLKVLLFNSAGARASGSTSLTVRGY